MKLRCSFLLVLAATTVTLAAVTETNGRFQRVTQLIERVKRQSVDEEVAVTISSNVTEDVQQHRDGRGLGSTLLQLGKLTLTHLLPLATGQSIQSSSSQSGTTSEKISSGNSVEIALPSSTDSPKIQTSSSSSSSSTRPCTTPDGNRGQCRDLGSCPALLLQLDSLRKSICFQSLFVPGVCCPESKPGNALVTIINQLAGGSNNNNNNNNRVTTTTTKRPTTIDYNSLTSPVTFAPTTTRPFETFLQHNNPIINTGSQSQGIQPKARCGQV